MDDDLTPRRRTSDGRRGHDATPWNLRLALVVFGLLVLLGPLAFGAVDRVVQIGLAALLGLGLLLHPPRPLPLSPWMNRVLLGLFVILIAKEVLPASWFGVPAWRTTIVESYGLKLPWTHHPEPGRVLDAWLVGIVAVVWFAWVRTLAIERIDRARLIWMLFGATAVVALASFGLQKVSSEAIFGLRYTPGWFGFGPFPNRNHTGDYLAMGLILGGGCVAYAGARKRFDGVSFGAFAQIIVLAALLKTQSRGALVALGAGVLIFLAAVVIKSRSGRAVGASLAVVLLLGGMSFVLGKKTMNRVSGTAGAGDDSAATRIAIWADTAKMWADAPLLGHGVSSFALIFPFYQHIEVEDVVVKHPESSFLQWLTEMGVLVVIGVGVVFAAFVLPYVRAAFERRSSFYIAAAGIGAVGVLVVHSLIDVPAHRWGTMGIALAALALACPARSDGPRGHRGLALVPLAIAGFWILPLVFHAPAWSPFQLERLIAQSSTPGSVSDEEIRAALRWFPLSPQLHLAAADRAIARRAPASEWQNHFRVAVRLVPASWKICADTARRVQPVSPSLAIHYWQMAVERASLHRSDAFTQALNATRDLPSAKAAWEGYIEAHPELALGFGENQLGETGKAYYDLWWAQRGSKVVDIPAPEATAFLRLAERWGTVDQIREWARRHPARRAAEYRRWAELMRKGGSVEEAWRVMASEVPDPPYPRALPKASREHLETTWTNNPADIVNARNYAQVLEVQGDLPASEAVILRVAGTRDAPKWFVEKAAYIMARSKRYEEAIDFALRTPARPSS